MGSLGHSCTAIRERPRLLDDQKGPHPGGSQAREKRQGEAIPSHVGMERVLGLSPNQTCSSRLHKLLVQKLWFWENLTSGRRKFSFRVRTGREVGDLPWRLMFTSVKRDQCHPHGVW